MDGKPYPVPKPWTKSSIGEVVVKATQRDPRRKPDEMFQYVDVSSVSNKFFKITNATPTLGSEAPSRARKAIETDDILFATVRPTLKRIALVTPEHNGAIASTGYCVLRCDKAKADPGFLYSFLITDHFNARMGGLERGASYPAVRDSDVKDSWLPLPPLPEQKKIAYILSTVQRAIKAQEQIIQTTTKLKKTLMHKLFTEGLRNEPQKETEIGPIPENWKVKTVGDYCNILNGYAFKSGDYVSSGGIPNFRVVNINWDGTVSMGSDCKFLPASFAESHQKYLLGDGDIMFVMVGATRGKLAQIPASILPALMNQNMWRIVPNDAGIDRDYLFQHLRRSVVELLKEGEDQARGFFKKSDFRSILLAVPPIDEQIEIRTVFQTLESKLAQHSMKASQLHDLFCTLLNELMTTNIRVAP